MFQFYMPTKVIIGRECVVKEGHLLKGIGNKALIVTGRYSAKKNGALEDVIKALEEQNMAYCVFDEVEENPSLETVEKAKNFGVAQGVDFVIGIGGGSPIDASKAIAQTGTSLPHGMGYALTYYKGLPHGLANGVLYKAYLRSFKDQSKVQKLHVLLGLESYEALEKMLDELCRVDIEISKEEIASYTEEMCANKAKLQNHPEPISKEEVYKIYADSLL